MDVQPWENSVLNQVLDVDGIKADEGECSQVPISWAQYLHPGVARAELLPQAGTGNGVDNWAGHSTKYFTWIANNPSDANQLPMRGAIIVFGATPAKGYSMTFKNPGGHTGVIKSASVSGYTIIEQNEPLGSGVHDGSYPWTLRPCLGWFVPVNQQAAAPNPAPAPEAAPVVSPNVGKQLNFPASVKSWWVYAAGGPYDGAHHTGVLMPAKYGGYSKPILRDLGNGLYLIHTDSYGDVAVWGSAPLTVS